MNTPGLFIVGVIVTLIVLGAVALLVYGALLDGRDIEESAEADAVRTPVRGGREPQAG